MSSETLSPPPQTAVTIRDWMVDYITSVIDVPRNPFPIDEQFDQYGLDSVEITIMCGMMEERFNIAVNPEEVFNNPTVSALAAHLAKRASAGAVAD